MYRNMHLYQKHSLYEVLFCVRACLCIAFSLCYWTVDGTKCYYVKGEKKVKWGKMLNLLCIIFADACFNFIKTVWSAQERNAHTVGHLDDRCNYL